MPRRLTSASFEIRHLSNAVRLMVTSFDKRAQTVRYTINRLSADDAKTPVATNTFTVNEGGFQTLRLDNLRAGFYEINLRISSRKLKPSIDIRDGSNRSDAEYCRVLITAGEFVRTDL